MVSRYTRTLHYEGVKTPETTPALPEDTLATERPVKTAAYGAVVSLLGSALIARADGLDRSLIVGVNGVDTAGKTEFTRSLADHITAANHSNIVAHVDDFMNPRQIRHQSNDEVTNYFNNMIDFQSIKDGLLEPARQGVPFHATFNHPHPADDSLRVVHNYSAQDAPNILLTEGVFLFRNELRDLFDVRIYLDLPFENVLERARARDYAWGGDAVLEKYHTKYIPTQEMYIALAQPATNAHVTVDMSDVMAPNITKLALPPIAS